MTDPAGDAPGDAETIPETRQVLPPWARILWDNSWRHLAVKGGRAAGAKSRTIAAALLTLGTESPRRVLCGREIQRSIRDSVKAVLDDEIARRGLGFGPGGSRFYTTTNNGIYGANGTRFLFYGLRHNVEQVKSIEGITDVWLEEARATSQDTLDTLEPTIRAPGSRLIYSYNPKTPHDPVDRMFFGGNPPPRSVRLHLQPEDNPWFPDVLREKMNYDAARDYARFLHIWRGAYWERDDAKVFTDWEVANFETPADAVLRFGADWGYSIDPTVLVRCFVGWWDGVEATADWRGDTLFIDREAFRVGVAIDDTPALFAGTDDCPHPRWRNPNNDPGVAGSLLWPITADSSRPETIAYMNARGFNVVPAVKGTGSVEDGVSFLQAYRIVVHTGCTNTADEMATYSWKVDPQTEQVLPVLKDKDNHTIDALRYALEGVRRAGSGQMNIRSASPRVTPIGKTPHEMQLERLRSRQDVGKVGWGTVPSRREGI